MNHRPNIAVAAALATAAPEVRSHVRTAPPVAPAEVRVESFRPAMAPRPDGMSRQVQRALYRKLCKRAGIDWRRDRSDRIEGH